MRKVMTRALRSFLSVGLLLSTAAAGESTTTLDLQALIDEALASNPSLAVLRHRLAAAEARIPQAGALADPMVMLQATNVPLSEFDFDSSPMSGKQLVFSQKLPYWGKLTAKEDMAERAAAVTQAVLQDREVVIVDLVKQAYLTLEFLDRSIEITQKNRALVRDFIRIAQTKYAVGRGLQQDVLKAQVSLSSIDDRLIKLRQGRGRAEAELNTVLNRLPQEPVGPTGSLTPTVLTLDVEELQRAAVASRPMLRAVEERIALWKASRKLADREYWPDFDFSLAYRQRDFDKDPVKGSDFLSLGVKLNLPIYRGRKQDQRVLEARARIRTAEAEYDDMRQQIFMQVQQLNIDISAHSEEAALFKTAIIPQADQSLSSAMAGYQVDKVDFLTLLDNQITLFNFEIDYWRHLIGYEKSLARLEAVVGKRLF